MIWSRPIIADDLTKYRDGTMADFIGIKFTEVGEDFLVATMPVNDRTFQPMRIMHGGASCVLAETLGSVAANCCVDHEKKVCVGLEINTSHIKMARSGLVKGTAR
ncbi:MAG TPA: hotdog fold thioesterase, partial [Parachlamydiaceae bacterium]|nr:hotdog fold thioesterase [Parachlamydiaceae bacterium]